MNRFRISQQSDSDLEDIWVYLAQHDSVAADLILASIFDKFPMIAKFPSMGKVRSDISKGLRSFPVKPYTIFYMQAENYIEIVRILHQSRDVESQF